MTKIAFLGLGAMGSRMVARLMGAEHDVVVWNRSPARTVELVAKGARVAATPSAAVSDVEFVISMVRDDAASHSVWLDPVRGAFAGMKRGAIAIESSTLSIAWIAELSQAAASRDVAFVDAPVAGSRPQAEAGQLIFMAGGRAEDLERVRPILSAMGSALHHAGPSGSGATVKLAVNALFAIQVSAMAELIGLLKQTSVDVARAIEIIGATPVASMAAKGAAAGMLAGQYSPMFPIALVEKDLDYVRGAAAKSEVPMIEMAQGIMRWAMDVGYGADNITGVAQLFDPPREKRFVLMQAAE